MATRILRFYQAQIGVSWFFDRLFIGGCECGETRPEETRHHNSKCWKMVVTTAGRELDKAGCLPSKKYTRQAPHHLASRFQSDSHQQRYQLLTINFVILALSSYGHERVTSMP